MSLEITWPSPGERFNLTLPGPVGGLEAIIEGGDRSVAPVEILAIVCHPHPLHQGTMQNKVVTTIAKSFRLLGLTTLRFNYRGVGRSEGTFGDVIGEVDDLYSIFHLVQQQYPDTPIWLSGFSFGSYVAAKVASTEKVEQLLSVAPSVERMNFNALMPITCPWLVVQGDKDELVPLAKVQQWFNGLQANKTLIVFNNTSHFFHGQLIKLEAELLKFYREHL